MSFSGTSAGKRLQEPTAGTTVKAKTHFFRNLDLTSVLDPSFDDGVFTGTKIMCTMGPSIHDVDILCQMLEAGMVSGRVDLTWGPLEFHRNSLGLLQEAMKRTRRLCSTVIDTMGRELMIRGQWQANDQGYPWVLGKNEVQVGQKIVITTREDAVADENTLPIMYSKFTSMTQPGDIVYIARYLVSGAEASSLYLEVTAVEGTEVICTAQNAATLEGLLCVFHAERSRGDGLNNVQNELPLLCEWDKHCIQQLGSEYEIDFINLSYTRSAEDVMEARSFLHSVGMNNTKILAKVETRQALLNFQGILSEADGIILSRGNLGLDVDPEKMALVQKTLIQACNLVGKPVIITRVVDTMVNTPRPTRAEATDVANAVLDGVDGILLGAETLRGKYPVETIKTVSSICRAAEDVFDHSSHYEYLMEAAWEAVEQLHKSESYDSEISAQMVINGVPTDAPGIRKDKRGSFASAVRAMAKYSMVASHPNITAMQNAEAAHQTPTISKTPYLSKLEAIASSAVRAADKVQAKLIVVYTHTGQTAELVAKYRPPMPIMTMVVPHLVSDGLKWRLEGRSFARQSLICRGLLPFLAAPSPNGEQLLTDAIRSASALGLVTAGDHIVVVQRVHEDFCIKIVGVNADSSGLMRANSSVHGNLNDLDEE